MDLERIKKDAYEQGFDIGRDDFIFALLSVLGFKNRDSYILMKGVDIDPDTMKPRDVRTLTNQNSARGMALSGKDSTKWLRNKLKIEFVPFIKALIKENVLLEKEIFGEYRKEQIAKDVTDNDFSLDEVNQFLITTIREANSGDVTLDVGERAKLIPLIKVILDRMNLSNPNEDRLNAHFVQIYTPFDMCCPHCQHETMGLEGHAVKCLICDQWIDLRPEKDKGKPIIETDTIDLLLNAKRKTLLGSQLPETEEEDI